MSATSQNDSQGDAEARERESRAQSLYGTKEIETRLAQATEIQAVRTPTPLESAALSAGSIATGIVLAGVVLIVIADAVNLVHGVNIWPLITIAVALAGAGGVTLALTQLSRRRAEDLLSFVAPWTMSSRLERIESKLDGLVTPETGRALQAADQGQVASDQPHENGGQ
jgi:hypothetical protein